MTTDVLKYLESKNLRLKRASATEVHFPCPFCSEPENKRGRCYANVDANAEIPGLFECKLCNAHGALPTLMRHFGDEPDKNAEKVLNLHQILSDAAEFAHDCLIDHPDVLAWLRGPERGLSMDTIVNAKLGYDDGRLWKHLRDLGHSYADISACGLTNQTPEGRTYDALEGMVTIPYFTAGNVVSIRGRAWPYDGNGMKYKTLRGHSVRLFNTDAFWGSDDIIVCEGEMDCLVVQQLGFLNAIALPGANVWQDAWDGYLAETRRVFTIFDNDPAGNKGLAKLMDRHGKKIRQLSLDPVKKVDPTTWVANGGTAEDLATLMRSQGRSSLLVTVEEAIAEHAEAMGHPGLKFGVELLDLMLEPGLQPAQVAVLLAKSGCLAGDTELNVNRGGKGFRITIADLLDRWEGKRYAWDRSTPTYVQREVDGVVRLGRIVNAWRSGVKQTYTVTTETGRTIRATDEHPFLTERGWLRLDQLVCGDDLHVRGEQATTGRVSKPKDKHRSGLRFHPHCKTRRDVPGGWKIPLHRLIYEATYLNHLSLDDYLIVLRTGLGVEQMRFVDPTQFAVHHIDGDHDNNDPANLKLLTHSEHAALHAQESGRNVLFKVTTERVRSVVPFGVEETYDIEVEDDPHNFLANGVVVHNTGKTIYILNAFQRMAMCQPDARFVFLSLEQTRSDWWERARRIYRFYNEGADDNDAYLWWRDRLLIVDRNRLTEDDVNTVLDEATDFFGKTPELCAMDYLGYWARAFKGEEYQRTSDAIMSIKAIAKDRRQRFLVPHQVNRNAGHGEEPTADDARASGVVEETADFVLTLWSEDNRKGRAEDEKSGELYQRIAKSRHGGRNTLIKYQFAPLSLVLVPQSDKTHLAKARDELRYERLRDTWETALLRHQRTLASGEHATPQLRLIKEA